MRSLLVPALLIAGCGGGSSASDLATAPDLAGPDLRMIDLSMPDLVPPLFEVHGFAKDFRSMAPVADMKICHFGTQNCVMTDAMGNFQLNDLPPGINVMISFEKTDYLKDLVEVFTKSATDGLNSSHFVTKVSDAMLLANALGDNLDLAKPGLIVAAFGNASGIAVATMPSPGGRGPIYFDEMGLPNPNLTATSMAGIALYFNNTAGDYDVTLTPMGMDKCTQGFGWAGLNGSTTQARLVAGYFTVVFPSCGP